MLHFAIHADEGDDLYRMVCHVTSKLVLGEIAAPFDASDVAPSVSGEPVFLPASRAGLMVAFRPLVGDAPGNVDPGLGRSGQFALPGRSCMNSRGGDVGLRFRRGSRCLVV